MSDEHDHGRPKRGLLPPFPSEETTGVKVQALSRQMEHLATTQELDTRQLHGRISEVAKKVTDLQVTNAAQTAILQRIEKAADLDRQESREIRIAELQGEQAIRLETARIPRTKMTMRTKIIVAAFALAATGIGAGIKLVAILHG